MKPIDAPSVQPRPLSRRRFLLNGATLGALLAPGILGLAIAPSGTAGGASMDMNGRGVSRAPFDKGAALVEPEVRRSANGELRTSLRVAYAYKDMGGYRLSLRTYEGNLPGPTLRLRPGDVLRIRLTNDLPPSIKVSHSRLNEVRESDLVERGYEILTRSEQAGVDIFARNFESRFVFFQGHPEYDALSLQREYMRDIARFLAGERKDYPAIPASYFDTETEEVLAHFERRAHARRRVEMAAELPGLTLRQGVPAGGAATTIFRNWLDFLRDDARVQPPESVRK